MNKPDTTMPLFVEAPVHLLDEGPLLKDGLKWWWAAQLQAQRKEIGQTLGHYRVLRDLDAIEKLSGPSVLVIPAITGGVVPKRDWWRCQGLLWQYVRRGGVVVVLSQAFCLTEEGQRAGGRTLDGVSTRASDNWLPGAVTFRRTDETDRPRALDADPLPAPLPRALEVETGHGFWVEHAVRNDTVGGKYLQIVAEVNHREGTHPLALRLAYPPHDYPGAILFLNTWSWMRWELDKGGKVAKKANRDQAEFCFRCLRAFNRELVQETLAAADQRLRQRTARLELLCGERDRLQHAMGGEKDYHRLLANDTELLLDLLAARDPKLLDKLHELFRGSTAWPEPPHLKGPDKRGRLDILLLAADEDLGQDATLLLPYLGQKQRKPVAWIELEAGQIDAEQIMRFAKGMKRHLHPRDFVCAVDRLSDDDANVVRVREHVEALGARFLHVQVPEAFDHLEERYLPELHRLQRRRYTVDVIRGLLG